MYNKSLAHRSIHTASTIHCINVGQLSIEQKSTAVAPPAHVYTGETYTLSLVYHEEFTGWANTRIPDLSRQYLLVYRISLATYVPLAMCAQVLCSHYVSICLFPPSPLQTPLPSALCMLPTHCLDCVPVGNPWDAFPEKRCTGLRTQSSNSSDWANSSITSSAADSCATFGLEVWAPLVRSQQLWPIEGP